MAQGAFPSSHILRAWNQEAAMRILRNTTTTLSIASATALLAILPACGRTGPAGQPEAGSSPSASTSVAATGKPATQGQSPTTSQPGTVTASPSQVLSFRLAYPWHWPNDAAMPGHVSHPSAVPPVPELVQIKVGSHPAAQGERAYDRISFTFTNAFPSYRIEFAGKLTGDPDGKVVPLGGQGVLKIVFTGAQAHTADGTKSSVISQPSPSIGLTRMTDYTRSGDFEGVLSYGIGITWPAGQPSRQLPVRAYEEETVAGGQHRYTVAIDVDASNPS
jgi:hypothetical protein